MRNYKQQPWSYKEKQILTNKYYMVSTDELLKALPNRTLQSCSAQALRLRREGWHFKRPQKQFF